MKYAICNFKSGMVYDKDGSLAWHEGSLEEAKRKAESQDGICALFHPQDVPDLGAPIAPDISRQAFEKEPGIYGVCYYHSASSGYVFE